MLESLRRMKRRVSRFLGRDDEDATREGLYNVLHPFTMLDRVRLDSLVDLSEEILQRGVEGCFLECGTCRGGSAAYLAWQSMKHGWSRELRLFDSFRGHPATTRSPDAPDRHIVEQWAGTMVASVQDVRVACQRVAAWSEEKIRIFPGWIEDTMAANTGDAVAFAHIDLDWYEPTRTALEILLPKMASGSLIQVDDYIGFDGCRKAVEEFITAHPGRVRKRKLAGLAVVLEVS